MVEARSNRASEVGEQPCPGRIVERKWPREPSAAEPLVLGIVKTLARDHGRAAEPEDLDLERRARRGQRTVDVGERDAPLQDVAVARRADQANPLAAGEHARAE